MPSLVVIAGGARHVVPAPVGQSVMEVARGNGFQVLGECNGSLACATCHVVVDPDWSARLPPLGEGEEAMLDSIFNLTATSRLGCQIRITEALDGLCIVIPG